MKQEVQTRNNLRIFGQGTQPMLFAHGFGCDQNMWRFITPAFEQDYRIILFDYVGSGKSDLSAYSTERYAGLEGYAQDIVEIVEALDLREIVFVGHSVSSMIGLLASLKLPDRFAELIMIGPSPCYLNDPPDYAGGFERADLEGLLDMMEKNDLGWASFLAPTIMKNPEQPELASELEASFCASDPKVAHDFARATFFSDNRDDLPRASVPSLILQCSEDAIAPESVGAYLSQHLPGSSLRILQATGHCPHMSHPDETIRQIRTYLESRTLSQIR